MNKVICIAWHNLSGNSFRRDQSSVTLVNYRSENLLSVLSHKFYIVNKLFIKSWEQHFMHIMV